jgi:hypothetical protein
LHYLRVNATREHERGSRVPQSWKWMFEVDEGEGRDAGRNPAGGL